ncbi:Na(+)/H(+) antiporter [Dictyocoela muelleri]|nr:Na(+)/H(+) antiporter [Dictyocoela muelleri]
MDDVFAIMSVVGGFILLFGLGSLFIKEKCFIGEPLVGTIFGIVVGPKWLNILNINKNEKLFFILTRILMNLQVLSVGIFVPKKYIMKEIYSLLMLLGPLMIITWIFSSIVIYTLIIDDVYPAMILGACVTPTDPVLANTLLKGRFANRYIPMHLRNLLSVESSANDGLGFPLFTLPFYLMTKKSTSEAFRSWIFTTWFREIFFGIFFGSIIGYLGRILLIKSRERKMIDKESSLAFVIVLGLFVTGISGLLKSDDILSSFACGLVFSWDASLTDDIRESNLFEVLDMLFNSFFFILFGSMMPDIADLKPSYFLCGLILSTLRRLPFFYIFKNFIPQLFNLKELFFAGWFGSIGVSAMFFSYLAYFESQKVGITNTKFYNILIPASYTFVFISILLTSITAPIINFHMKRRGLSYEEQSESDYTENEDRLMVDKNGKEYFI